MAKKTVQQLFPGIIVGSEPEVVYNRFGGDSVVLSAEEVAVYDLIMGCELIQDYKTMRKGIDWFMKNNIQAYMTLLD